MKKAVACVLAVVVLAVGTACGKKENAPAGAVPPTANSIRKDEPRSEHLKQMRRRWLDLTHEESSPKNLDRAREIIAIAKRAIDEKVDLEFAYFDLGQLYWLRGPEFDSVLGREPDRLHVAAAYFQSALQYNPRNVLALTYLAEYYLDPAGNQPERGYELLHQVLAIEPANAVAFNRMDKAHVTPAEVDAAVAIYRRRYEEFRDQDEEKARRALEFAGRALIVGGRYEEAEKILQQAAADLEEFNVKYGTYYGCPYQALGLLYTELQQPEKAAEYNRKAADLELFALHTQVGVADQYRLVKDFQTAWKYYQRARALSDSRPVQALGERLRRDIRLAGLSEEDFAPLEADPPGWVDFEAALKLFAEGDYARAKAFTERALAAGYHAPYAVLKGYIFLFERKYEEAEALFSEAMRRPQPDFGAPVGLGHLNVIKKNYEAALRLFREPWYAGNAKFGHGQGPIPPADQYLWLVYRMTGLGLAWTAANQSDHQNALPYYDNILARQPDDWLALIGKGNSLSGLQRLDEAEAIFKAVLAKHPDNPYALAEMALIQYNKGKDEAAEKYFRRALAKDDKHYTCPYEGLGLIYLRQGKIEAAKENLQKAIEINPTIEYKKFNALAKIYIKEGKSAEAEKLLRQSIANYPHDPEAKELLDRLLQANGERTRDP
jgi:tetratricopeptide (TPR) repeat protein